VRPQSGAVVGAENSGIARRLRFIAPTFEGTHALLAGREEFNQ